MLIAGALLRECSAICVICCLPSIASFPPNPLRLIVTKENRNHEEVLLQNYSNQITEREAERRNVLNANRRRYANVVSQGWV
jgi:hypothetical protein